MTPAITHARGPAATAPTSTAPLLYWLLVICGLAGLTVQRLDTLGEVLPLWAGTIVGLAVGQLVAWARIRLWVFWAMGMIGFWLAPLFMILFYSSLFYGIDPIVNTCFYAAVPAAICGYLALSERGALLAFWYPAVLWMLVILDGPSSTTIDTHAALPLVIGLTALFVAYLRARETRRVALWRTHAPSRLATPVAHTVLRASPLRAASQHAWTAIAGAGALVLATWIAPHLWQTEKAKHTSHASAASAPHGTETRRTSSGDVMRCCSQAEMLETKRVRVREYFPLVHGTDEDHGLSSSSSSSSSSCTVCQDGDTELASSTSDYDGLGNGTTAGSGWSTDTSPPPYAYGGNGGLPSSPSGAAGFGPPSSPHVASPGPWDTDGTPLPATPPTPPAPVAAPPPAPPAPVVVPPHAPAAPAAAHPLDAEPAAGVAVSKYAHATGAAPTVVVLQPAAAAPGMIAPPWETVLFASVGALALRALLRGVRRKLRLRHLARPFWPETLDQRISNHWERMLVALRDAGIHASDDEQPEALAKRVGIEGMETCATILERVRHGVRVDSDDLATMDAAAGAVVRAAEQRAGLAGRAAALVRWPLA